jgi:cytochrome c553
MKRWAIVIALAGLPLSALAAEAPPMWAYFFPDANQPPAGPEDTKPKTLPGSTKSYTQAQIDDLKHAVDWFPNEHAPMPKVVADGGDGPVLACAVCHLASGMGHPESSSLAGLTPAYMEQQINDFKSGARYNPVIVNGMPQNNATQFMVNIAKGLSDADSKAAAEWFAALKPIPDWVKVVEARNVPKSYVSRGYMRVAWPGGGMEPLGARIVELPKNENRQLLRDPHFGTVAYVPVGSIKRGEALVTKGGGGKTTACAACHGADLKGLADVPDIAGRSPLYLFRQLDGFRTGSRGGMSAALMIPVVAKLTQNDEIDIAAYLASRPR